MAFSTFSGSNAGNRAFQLNGEMLGGIVASGSGYFGGLAVFTGSTDGIPEGAHSKYALSRSFADNDATGSIIQALNFVKAVADDGASVTFTEVSGALASSTSDIILGNPARNDNVVIHGSGKIIANGDISSSAGITLATDAHISSSGGGTFLGTIITNTVEASSSVLVAGNAGVTGNIHVGGNMSGAADVAGQELKIQDGATITGSSVFHGAMSSAFGSTFLGGVIAKTLEASSSIFAGGAINVSGALSGTHFSALANGNTLVEGTFKVTNNVSLTGTTIQHGGFSSSQGATFVEGLIGSTGEFSSSVFIGKTLVVTGATGFILGTSVQSNTSVVAGAALSGTSGVAAGGENTIRFHNTVKEPLLNVSGTLFVSGAASPNPIKLQLGESAASHSLDSIPYMQFMGVDGGGLLQLYKLQVSGGMLQVNQV